MNPARSALLRNPTLIYLCIALPLWALTVWAAFYLQAGTGGYGGDFWEHSASLKSWMENLSHPANPHLLSDAASPRYMPFYLLIASVGQWLALDPLQAMGLAGALSITLFLVAVPLFFNRYFRNRWAGVIALLVLLLGWGSSWLWSNVYQLRTLFYTISYPSFFVIALSLLTFALLIKMLRSDSTPGWRLALLALLVAILVLSHPLTGAFAGMTLGLMVLSEPGAALRTRAVLLVALATGALLTFLWPWYPIAEVFVSGSATQGSTPGLLDSLASPPPGRSANLIAHHPFYAIDQILFTLGPLLIGIPALLWMAWRRVHLFAPLGALAMLLPYAANLVINLPLGHRFLLFFIFYCQVAVIWLLLRLWSDTGTIAAGWRWLAGSLLAVTVAWNLALAGLEVAGHHLSPAGDYLPNSHESPIAGNSGALVNRYRLFSVYMEDDSIVMAQAGPGWPLPTFAGKVVTLLHPNPLVPDLAQRHDDALAFFAADSEREQRLALLAKYQATHLLLDRNQTDPATLTFIDSLKGISHRIKGLELIELAPATASP